MAGSSWKVAYADFVTAMMAFFLLMWILNMVPPEKKQEMAVYFMDPGGYDSRAAVIDFSNPPPLSGGDSDLEKNLSPAEADYLAINRLLSDLLQEQVQANKIKLNPTEAGVMLRTSYALTFGYNSVDLPPEGEKVLAASVEVMRRFKVRVTISGHTDSSEDGAPRLRGKWELAAARAAAATSFLVDRGGVDPAMVVSISYADFRPIVPDSAEAPEAVNRRVEFFFQTPEAKPGPVSRPAQPRQQ